MVEGNTAFLFAEPPIRLAKGLGGSSFFALGGLTQKSYLI